MQRAEEEKQRPPPEGKDASNRAERPRTRANQGLDLMTGGRGRDGGAVTAVR